MRLAGSVIAALLLFVLGVGVVDVYAAHEASTRCARPSSVEGGGRWSVDGFPPRLSCTEGGETYVAYDGSHAVTWVGIIAGLVLVALVMATLARSRSDRVAEAEPMRLPR